MPADATIVSLRSDTAEAPAARRDCPREQPERRPREQPEQPIERSSEGVVTSLKEEHENSASRIFSNDRNCLAPHVHSRRAKGSVRPCRSEMTLDVESVVGGCVS
jgi:hypothetical protein